MSRIRGVWIISPSLFFKPEIPILIPPDSQTSNQQINRHVARVKTQDTLPPQVPYIAQFPLLMCWFLTNPNTRVVRWQCSNRSAKLQSYFILKATRKATTDFLGTSRLTDAIQAQSLNILHRDHLLLDRMASRSPGDSGGRLRFRFCFGSFCFGSLNFVWRLRFC